MSAPIGNWQKAMELLLEHAKLTKKMDTFATCKSGEDIMNIAMSMDCIHQVEWLEAYFLHCRSLNQKSTDNAARSRVEGNKLFQRKQYSDAVLKYTEAIIHSPAQSDDLPLAYGNRSASLFRLQKYELCLQDIEQAYASGYPDCSRYKLDTRKVQSLLQIGDRDSTITVCETAIENLQLVKDLTTKKKDELIKELTAIKKACVKDSDKPITRSTVEDAIPTPSYGCNTIFVQASTGVDMKCNKERGRFLVANRDIIAGDTLIVERPFAFVLLPDHYSTHCHHCLAKLDVVYPCRQCTVVRYCRPECRDESWDQYHYVECHYLDLLHSVGIAHLSLRIILMAGKPLLREFLDTRDIPPPPDHIPGLDGAGQYRRNYQAVYDLVTHAGDMVVDDVFQYSQTAVLLLKILQDSGWFGQDKFNAAHRNVSDKPPLPNNCALLHCDHDTVNKKVDTEHANNDPVIKACKELSTEQLTLNLNWSSTERCNNLENCVASSVTGKQKAHSMDVEHCPMNDHNLITNDTHTDGASQRMCCGVDTVGDTEVDNLTTGTKDQAFQYYIGSLLLRHMQQLVCNAHAITDLHHSQAGEATHVEETRQVRIATAIYPTASLINHSCDPTIILSFHNDTLIVRAVKDVPKGGEIFNCYGPHHRRMGWQERQQALKEQYFFTCACEPCLAGLDADRIFHSFCCPGCEGSIHDTPSCPLCETCGASIDMMNLRHKASIAEKSFQRGLELLHQNHVEAATEAMLQCYTLRKSVLYMHNKLLGETEDCLARCYATKGEFVTAARYLKSSMVTVELMYGSQSIEVANELQKLSEILISAQDWKQALTVTGRAITLFELHYGKSHDTVKELSLARQELLEIVQ